MPPLTTRRSTYVIVGAGSAGCVLADRLTEDGKHSVLVLEYGGSDRSIFIQMPGALSIPMNMAKYNWRYETEPEPDLDGRRLHTPRGKVLGGSSSINGLVYVRGNPLDFERWEEEGAAGWGYRARAALFPARRDARRGRRRLSRRRGPAPDPLRHAATIRSTRAFDRGGAAGRLSATRRHQRLPAGRLRPHGHDRRRRAALERRERLSAPGDEAPEPRRAHRMRSRRASSSTGGARSACAIVQGGTDARRPRAARGDRRARARSTRRSS